MKFLKRIFSKKTDDEFDWGRDSENEEDIPRELSREKLNMNRPEQLEEYVRNCCEQIREATQEIENATMEYRFVTDHLTDMEELEQLPNEDRADINMIARKFLSLRKNQRTSEQKVGRISEAQFENMERMCSELPQGIEELQKNEDYKSLVKQDLQKLEGEKASCRFRRRDLNTVKKSAREIALLLIGAMILVTGMLLVFQYVFEMEVRMGYLITIGLGALGLTGTFIKYNNAYIELAGVEHSLTHIISLQNTVKIRYVNVTSVIEYAYSRFGVNSSNELNYLWEKYNEEKDERRKLQEANSEMEEQKKDLLKELKRQRIKDAEIWIHQIDALVNEKEMVEIRHQLIVRRQSLRKRIDYNRTNRENAKNEITDLVQTYPRYSSKILGIVSSYD